MPARELPLYAMRVVASFPHQVEEIENCWISLPDGSRLAARIWLPACARRDPVPAILEYIPYRKRDRTRERDEPMHHYFAGHGYAAVRIDIRGSGDSDGLLLDEYLPEEQEDAVAAIGWIAEQPWCNGAVGMIGKSWGGFNSLQVAARAPAPLGAIITVCSTDDRYADDAHFMGGCLLNENLIWGSVLLTLNVQAPDPVLVGPRWREMWLERLEHTPLFTELWLNHQRRDAYWEQGSVCEDFSRIRCPVYAISGWADGYSNAVPRLVEGLRGPRKGLIGPWAHVYPHEGVPRPAIGFLQEALRWWDHWLRGIDTGIMDEPVYRVWMQSGVRPRSFYAERPGRWVAEESWPSPRIQSRAYELRPDGLAPLTLLEAATPAPAGREPGSGVATRLVHRSPLTVGFGAGAWCGFGIEGEMPTDQREDDGKSLCFDSPALAAGLEILGAPELWLEIAVDRPLAILAARLNDVAPDGASTRISYGLLNLTHRRSHVEPERLEPGERVAVRLRLNDVAHAFAPGHRIRLALSTSYWPVAWPSPEPVELSLFAGPGSRLELPFRPPRLEDAELAPFGPPEAAPGPEATELETGRARRFIQHDLATGETLYEATLDVTDTGAPALWRIEPIDLVMGHAIVERFRLRTGEPLSAQAEIVHVTESQRQDWSVQVVTRTRFRATLEAFLLEAELEARERGRLVFARAWRRTLPRDLV